VNVSGATAASYTTAATTTTDSGGDLPGGGKQHSGNCDECGGNLDSDRSGGGSFDHRTAHNQTVTAGQTATFTVVATGATPLTYQWQKNGVNVSGATAASYTTAATTTTDSGATFRVVVSNTAGTVTSAAATLTVTAAAVAPSITAQPTNQTVTAGQTATFTVVATGAAPLTYQWQKNGGECKRCDSGELHGGGDNDGGQRGDLPGGGKQHSGNCDECGGDLDSDRSGGGSFDHRAAHKPDSYSRAASDVHGGGDRGDSTHLPVAEERSECKRCDSGELHDGGDNDDGQRGDLPGGGKQHSGNCDECGGNLDSDRSGGGSFDHRTAHKPDSYSRADSDVHGGGDGGGSAHLPVARRTGVNVSGATAASYTAAATTTADSGATFRVVVSNTAGTVTSAAATLTVTAAAVAPSITAQPTNQTVTAGQTATFQRHSDGQCPAELPVEQERRGHRRSDFFQLHHSGYHFIR